MNVSDDLFARGRTLLEQARRVFVLTGAGISAESGVPTFRGTEGLWKSHRPEELATPAAFARDPRFVWEWYGWRRERVAACAPNAAHRALASFARRGGVTIATQNVDGLHSAAGAGAEVAEGASSPSAAELIELHGSLFRVRCTSCRERRDHRDRIDASAESRLPRCERCNALMRPDVVWFGEALDSGDLERAMAAAAAADVCLVIGTSAVVQPAAGLAHITRRAGGAVIEVNPEATPLTPIATLAFRSGAVEAIPRLTGASTT